MRYNLDHQQAAKTLLIAPEGIEIHFKTSDDRRYR